MSALEKYNAAVQRLVGKIERSQTPVPGFVMSLSGTDSIIAFLMIYEALRYHGMAHRLQGYHYISTGRRKPHWFDTDVKPWLHRKCPKSWISTEFPLGGNQDQQRWADLHLRALNHVEQDADGNVIEIKPYETGKNFWVAGTINATEFALGTYNIAAKSVSIQPIQTFWKSEIIELCQIFGVPDVAIQAAQLPDCLCGRDELAASNIKLIDDILRFRLDAVQHDPVLIERLFEYIRSRKAQNDFKSRTPYVI